MKKLLLSLLLMSSLTMFGSKLDNLIYSRKVEAVKEYLDFNPGDIGVKNQFGIPPLMTAVDARHIEIIKLLLDRGADIEVRGIYNNTALILAVKRGYVEIIKLLLDRGADIEPLDEKGFTPLWTVISDYGGPDSIDIVQLLINHGAKVEFSKKQIAYFIYQHPRGINMFKLLKKSNIENIKNMQPGFLAYEKRPKGWRKEALKSFLGRGSQLIDGGRDQSVRKNYSKVRFANIGGYDSVKDQLKDCVRMIKHPKRYKRFGIGKIPHTILHGPPGTGKTLFATAIAGEAKIPFIITSGSELRGSHIGESSKLLREKFAEAENLSIDEQKPVLLFIDEFDSIGKDRKSYTGNCASEESATVNQLLTLIDGGQHKATLEGAAGKVFVVAATNGIGPLDPALLRAGRFSRQIFIGMPNETERYMILKTYKQYPLGPDVDLAYIARETEGFNGAALANLLEESAHIAARNYKKTKRKKIYMDDVNKALIQYKESRSTMSDGSTRLDDDSATDDEAEMADKITKIAGLVYKKLFGNAKL